MNGMSDRLRPIVGRYKNDSESVYNTWFVDNDARLKAFRSIRRGVQDVVQDIKAGSFGNDFKGSSLEFVLTCITEQKQVVMEKNNALKSELSNDLGALAGLLFDVGVGTIQVVGETRLSEQDRARIEKRLDKRHKEVMNEKEEEQLHSEMQYHLLKIGKALG